MDDKTIHIVQDTWRHIPPIADTALDLFYGRLFELDPGLKPLFAGTDMTGQKTKLLSTLATTIAGLNTSATLPFDLRKLGQRHAGYGVLPGHYDTVGEALLWTLEKGLGDHWSDEVCAAWTAAYTLIAEQMQAGAATAQCEELRQAN